MSSCAWLKNEGDRFVGEDKIGGNGKPLGSRKGGGAMKLDDVMNHFLLDCETRGVTPGAMRGYKVQLAFLAKKLEQECQITDIEQVKIVHLRQFIRVLMNTKADENNPRKPTQEKPLSPFTVRNYVRAIRTFFQWCVDEELLEVNPSTRLALPKMPSYVIRAFTAEHIDAMLGACDVTTPLGFRDYVMLLVLLDTGMRLAELSGLKMVDVYDRYVKVFGKGRKEREIGLHPEVSKLLWKYIHKYRKPIAPNETSVFLNRSGKPLLREGVTSVLDAIKRKCGLENVRVSPHTFRHTFAKMYLERGGEIFKLSREMGHSGVQVTEVYLRDFKSTEARQEHVDFSPIGEIQLHNSKKRGRRKSGG
jgi:integrase/recombinase XerD